MSGINDRDKYQPVFKPVDHSNNAEFIRVIVAIPQKTLKDILEIDPNIVFSIGRFSTAIFKGKTITTDTLTGKIYSNRRDPNERL